MKVLWIRNCNTYSEPITPIGVRARGAGVLSPPDSGKTIIFRAKAKFFRQKTAAKNAKNGIHYMKNGIHSL